MFFNQRHDIIRFTIIVLWSITIMIYTNRNEKNKRFHDLKCRKELQRLTKYNKRKQSQPQHQLSVQGTIYTITANGRKKTYSFLLLQNCSIGLTIDI